MERLPPPADTRPRGDFPHTAQLLFSASASHSIMNPMREQQAMLDAIRDDWPIRPLRRRKRLRADHLKDSGSFSDASLVGICELPASAILEQSHTSPDVVRPADDLRIHRPKTRAAGIEMIMSDLKDTLEAPSSVARIRKTKSPAIPYASIRWASATTSRR